MTIVSKTDDLRLNIDDVDFYEEAVQVDDDELELLGKLKGFADSSIVESDEYEKDYLVLDRKTGELFIAYDCVDNYKYLVARVNNWKLVK